MTWLLAPTLMLLTLTATGPIVTGTLEGYAPEPCPVVGSITGNTVGLTATCEPTFTFLYPIIATQSVAVVLHVQPDLTGTWRLGSESGTLVIP